eukprot:599105-Rhodomonas_salina.1
MEILDHYADTLPKGKTYQRAVREHCCGCQVCALMKGARQYRKTRRQKGQEAKNKALDRSARDSKTVTPPIAQHACTPRSTSPTSTGHGCSILCPTKHQPSWWNQASTRWH